MPSILPFTREQFLAVFAAYNQAIWPAQIVAYVLGLLAVWLTVRRGRSSWPVVAAILAAMWAWNGVAYHLAYFSPINRAAIGFGVLFCVQALLLVIALRGSGRVEPVSGVRRWLGLGLIGYAMAVYPLAGLLAGETYPALPMFGVAPCPLTLFTFGLLLLTFKRRARYLLAVPMIWSLIGGSAAILLAVPQDWLLLVSGLAVLALAIRPPRPAAMTAPA
ncbi:MAG: DUF6064 family protein [Bauldia sp.]